jgi:exoribonuclease II
MNISNDDIVDYYDSHTIACGLVLEIEDKRVRMLTEKGKELKISASRILISGRRTDFPINASREDRVLRLKEISERREEIKNGVSLKELWEVVSTETDRIDLADLTGLLFGNEGDIDLSASLIRAILQDKTYFKIKSDHIEVSSWEQVNQAVVQREREHERINFIARSGEFLNKLSEGKTVTVEAAPSGLISILESAAELGTEWVSNKSAKDIFRQSGLPLNRDPLWALVKLGVWSEDENIRLRSERISVQFSEQAQEAANSIPRVDFAGTREDLTNAHLITVDATTTLDIDDALSVERLEKKTRLGIHITDASLFVDHDSLLDKEIRDRGISIYLPDTTIPMMPPALSEEAASLVAGQERPAISVLATFGEDLVLEDSRIVESVVRVGERLSYEDADERITDPDSPEACMYALACSLRRSRIASGALIFKDPEISVRVAHHGEISISKRDRESPSQVLVSEMMIFANGIFAKFLKDRSIPAIFRSQQPPSDKIDLPDEYDPVLSYRAKKALARGDLGISPAPHSTLGLEAYTTATSPLRRYTDLVVQRQIKAVLSKRSSEFSPEHLERIIGEISYKLDRASLMERERQRYFLMKYLDQNRNEELDAIVLNRFPRFYLVQLTKYCFNAALFAPGGVNLGPGNRCVVQVEKINPREDRLALSLVKIG